MPDRNRAGDEFDAFLEQADGGTLIALLVVVAAGAYMFLRVLL